MVQEKRERLHLLPLVLLCLWVAPAAAQDDTRPAGVTMLGDTGLWFVPTAEVVADGEIAASGHLSTFNRQQGLAAIQSLAGTFALGVRDRACGHCHHGDREGRPSRHR